MRPIAIEVDGASSPFVIGTALVGGLEIMTTSTDLGRGTRIDATVRNPSREPIAIHRITFVVDAAPELVLEHGHQSWSCVRRTAPADVRPERAEAPDWVRGSYHHDVERSGHVVSGDQFLVTTDGVVGWLDGRTHFGTVEAPPRGTLRAVALLDGVAVPAGGERRLEPLWIATGDPGPAYSELAVHWGRTAGARTTAPASIGWCSWYQYFAEVTPDDVRANLTLAAEHDFAVVQIDDGWQAAIGDWRDHASTWPDGIAPLAKEIATAGLQAGVWTAPFLAAEHSRLATDHPDWLAVHTKTGRPMKAAYNDDNWGGWTFALDTTNPAVLEHLRTTYSALRADGFDYHKIDFCFAAALPATRRDPTLTRAEALRAGLEAVRDGIGDDGFLLGCGCPFGPAVGVVDAMRVSADVAPAWEPAAHWPGFAESAPAAVNAVAASVLRAPLHRRLFINDPDCLLLRPTDTELEADDRTFLVSVIAGVGGFTIISDDMTLYTDAEWRLLEAMRSVLEDVDVPLDIDDPFADPVVVRSQVGSKLTVDWRPGHRAVELGT